MQVIIPPDNNELITVFLVLLINENKPPTTMIKQKFSLAFHKIETVAVSRQIKQTHLFSFLCCPHNIEKKKQYWLLWPIYRYNLNRLAPFNIYLANGCMEF